MFWSKKDKPGYYKGKHYTEWVDQVKQLKREDKQIETEKLLLALVDAVEAESKVQKLGAAPWYYEELAIAYRKAKNYSAEIEVLERFNKQTFNKKPDQFLERIEKAKALLKKVQ